MKLPDNLPSRDIIQINKMIPKSQPAEEPPVEGVEEDGVVSDTTENHQKINGKKLIEREGEIDLGYEFGS